ncbi:MAG: ATP-binding protein [Nitrososphaerales archaeon]
MLDRYSAIMRVSAVLENLRVIRRFVEDEAKRANFAGQRVDDLVLAVDEAATNIIMHGYGVHAGTDTNVIEVEVAFRDPLLSVHLRDHARPFDPTALPVVDKLPPLTERGPGGLGVFLIRKTMDEFGYRRTPDGWNELTLSVYKPPDSQED